ncbi:MAG: tetratricopeptide repeat protein [Syntrophomonadaceae bacterium]
MGELPSIKPLLDAAFEYYQLHNVSRALFCYQQALEWEVPDLRLWKGLANCNFILGDFDKALQYWEKAAELDGFDEEVESRLGLLKSPSFQSWLKRMSDAVKTVEMKDYSRARDLFMDLLEEKDGVVSLYQILGLTHMACSDPGSAKRVWSKGLQFDSSNPMLLKYLQSLDEIEKGIEVEKEPEEKVQTSKYRLILGSAAVVILGCLGFFLLSRLGIYADKPAPLQVVPANAPASTTIETGLKSRTAPVSVQSEARPVSRGAISESEQLNLLVRGKDLGNQMESTGEWQHYREGFTDYLKGDLGGARLAFSQVVNKNSGSYINRESLYYLARINYLLGDRESAESYFQKYLAQFAGTDYYDESLYFLGCIYNQTGREEQARAMLRKLEIVAPDSGYLSSKSGREILNSTR